jgi:predicted membrane channel-forming protein YqfA (hemolysin III family)
VASGINHRIHRYALRPKTRWEILAIKSTGRAYDPLVKIPSAIPRTRSTGRLYGPREGGETVAESRNEWHLFVLGGSVCHFVVMFLFVVPSP